MAQVILIKNPIPSPPPLKFSYRSYVPLALLTELPPWLPKDTR